MAEVRVGSARFYGIFLWVKKEGQFMLSTVERDQFGLMTRESFLSCVQKRFQEGTDGKTCIVSVDIEHLKLLNNWFGQQMGDRVLGRFASTLLKLEKDNGYLVGRFGSDDFFLFMPDEDAQIRQVYENVCAAISEVCPQANFRPVVGVCAAEKGETDAAMLCNNAQIAADAARGKEEERVRRFDHTMMHNIHRKQRLIADMKKALQDEGFTYFLQPKCNSVTGKIIGMEALARWEHPEIGSVSPAEFVPLMEQSGMITWLDRFVWEGACRTLHDWSAEGHKVVPISVNVSRQDFDAIDVPENFHQLVSRYSLDPRLIRVEITETMFAENMEEINQAVERLHQYGFTVLMDDFGSGYSSLNMLKDTNVDVLKLDMKFIKMNKGNREKGVQIVDSIVDMAHKLRIAIIAEGVENQEQIDMLRSMGCIYVQGYYFYKPLPVEEVCRLFDKMDIDDYACTDLRRKNTAESGMILRDIKTERDALSILGESALVLAGMNLDTGEMQIAKAEVPFPKNTENIPIHFALFNNLLIAQDLIHPEDQAEYLRITALSHLREAFFGGQKQIYLSYRRKREDGQYRRVGLILVAGKQCDPEHARIAIVMRDIDGEAFQESSHKMAVYYIDALTGLYNRARFERDVERYDKDPSKHMLCVYIDVVGLHEINNHLGHKAGDGMLSAVAGAARSVFPKADVYRIGGDEFVILSENMTCHDGEDIVQQLRKILRESNYEISVGLHQRESGETMSDAVDRAENAMRKDKRAYYERTGNMEQMRMLNMELERILVEKRDADQFLHAIASHYMGVYIVNTKTGKMRSIFIPEHFKRMETDAQGMFFPALKEYEREMVKESWRAEFDKLFDYDDVKRRISESGILYLTYQKKDDTWVRLQVMKYMEDGESEGNTDLLMWIFANTSQRGKRA